MDVRACLIEGGTAFDPETALPVALVNGCMGGCIGSNVCLEGLDASWGPFWVCVGVCSVGRSWLPSAQPLRAPAALCLSCPPAEVVADTHYLPRHWRGRAHTREVQQEFEALFQVSAFLSLQACCSSAPGDAPRLPVR